MVAAGGVTAAPAAGVAVADVPSPGVGPEWAAAAAALVAPVVRVTSGGTSEGSRRSAQQGTARVVQPMKLSAKESREREFRGIVFLIANWSGSKHRSKSIDYRINRARKPGD